jgi:hypothetical protein
VFIGGTVVVEEFTEALTVVAYDVASGDVTWVSKPDGVVEYSSAANALAVSQDGSRVFAAGFVEGQSVYDDDYATVSLDAATGSLQWRSAYTGPRRQFDGASGVALSPDGSMVVVTGNSESLDGDDDWATVAYEAS